MRRVHLNLLLNLLVACCVTLAAAHQHRLPSPVGLCVNQSSVDLPCALCDLAHTPSSVLKQISSELIQVELEARVVAPVSYKRGLEAYLGLRSRAPPALC